MKADFETWRINNSVIIWDGMEEKDKNKIINQFAEEFAKKEEWIDVRDRLPELIDCDGERISDFVLCVTRKFGFAQNRTETDNYVVLYWDGKTWQDYETEDYENNADYITVIYWRKIPYLTQNK